MDAFFTCSLYGVTAVLLGVSFLKDKRKTVLSLKKAWKMFTHVLPQFISILFLVGLLLAVVVVNGILLIFQPQREMTALRFIGQNLMNFLLMLTPIFICIGLLDIWIERDTMVKIMGETSGCKGALTALLLGVVTAVPLYALLPVAGVLLKKGCRIANVLLFLCASASIRIPLLLFEISSLGGRFTFVRLGLNIVVVVAISFIVEKLLTNADKKEIYKKAGNDS